jgi:hypothetical protein
MSLGADHHPPRFFQADRDIRRIVAGLLDCSLPRMEWTHEAHLAAVSGFLLEKSEMPLEQQLPAIISSYNIASGGVNDDTQGYHETLTHYWIASARSFHSGGAAAPLVARVNRYIGSPEGRRDAPFRHYSRELLFSVAARRSFLDPDLMPFEWAHVAPAPQY